MDTPAGVPVAKREGRTLEGVHHHHDVHAEYEIELFLRMLRRFVFDIYCLLHTSDEISCVC